MSIELSVVIPMYNEAKRIGATLGYITNYLKRQSYAWEIIAVSDGSHDNSASIAESFESVRVVAYEVNRGKGYAVHTGMSQAKGRLIALCDADNATPFEQIERLREAIIRADVAIGSRYVPGSHIVLKQPLLRVIGSRIGNMLIQLLILPGIRDTQCGFKLFTREAVAILLPRQSIWRWGFDMELLVIAREHGLRMVEVPVDWTDQTGSKVHSSRAFTSTLRELGAIWLNRLQGRYARSIH